MLYLLLVCLLMFPTMHGQYLSGDEGHVSHCRQLIAEITNHVDLRRQTKTKCACFEHQIKLDYSFERKEKNCYQEWLYNDDGYKQMCCYGNDGQLLVGAPGGGYIVMTPEKINNLQIHSSCCQEGGHHNSEMCENFYSIFPSDNCSSYHIPHSVMSWGDPSIQTLDGNSYDFNGHGEYIFLNTRAI